MVRLIQEWGFLKLFFPLDFFPVRYKTSRQLDIEDTQGNKSSPSSESSPSAFLVKQVEGDPSFFLRSVAPPPGKGGAVS